MEWKRKGSTWKQAWLTVWPFARAHSTGRDRHPSSKEGTTPSWVCSLQISLSKITAQAEFHNSRSRIRNRCESNKEHTWGSIICNRSDNCLWHVIPSSLMFVPTFRWNIPSQSARRPWSWRREFPLKFQFTPTRPYGAASHKKITFVIHRSSRHCGARGGVVVKTVCYKPAGRGFDSRWCHWNFLVT